MCFYITVCGIAGYIGIDLQRARPVVRDMIAHLRHRGPDDFGVFNNDAISLAQARLAVLDIEGGRQPWRDSQGNCLVFNGEIYNAVELSRKLSPQYLRSHSDTEVLFEFLRGGNLHRIGELEGMFAFAYWDEAKRELSLCRDYYGEKPLYWVPGPGGAYFASDDRSLVLSNAIHRTVSFDKLCSYLTHRYVPRGESIWEGIETVKPGEVITMSEFGEVLARSNFQPAFLAEVGNPAPYSDEALISSLEEATKAELHADVPVGVFLSGGIDSSAVALAASRHSHHLKAFTLATGFNLDDVVAAREVARRLGLQHLEFQLPESQLAPLVRDSATAFGSPFADSSAPLVLALARFAQKEVTVVLGGDGADELLFGYSQWVHQARKLSRSSGSLTHQMSWLLTTPEGRAYGRELGRCLQRGERIKFPISPVQHHLWQTAVFKPAQVSSLLGTSRAQELIQRQWSQETANIGVEQFLLRDYLPGNILTKSDRMTMATSLELRSPFLHPLLTSIVGRLNSSERMDVLMGKRPVREWLSSQLGDVSWGRSKAGFGAPVGIWLKGPLAPLVSEVAASSSDPLWQLVDPAVGREVLKHSNHQTWSLLVLALWSREFL